MVIITLDGLTNTKILKNFYLDIEISGLHEHFFIIYKPDIKKTLDKEKLLLNKIISHALFIDINQLEGYEEPQLEDFILDIMELDNYIVFLKDYNGKNKKFSHTIYNIIETFNLRYVKFEEFDFNKEIDFKNINYNDYMIVKEIFEEETEKKYYAHQFILNYSINNKGILLNEKNESILDLNKDSVLDTVLQFYNSKYDTFKKELNSRKENRVLDEGWYEPHLYVMNRDLKKVKKKIIDYKYRIFEKLKSIKPEQYIEINQEIVKIMNNNGYIQFNDIIEIIK